MCAFKRERELERKGERERERVSEVVCVREIDRLCTNYANRKMESRFQQVLR